MLEVLYVRTASLAVTHFNPSSQAQRSVLLLVMTQIRHT